MTISLQTIDPVEAPIGDDGLYRLECPRCGRLITRFHPKSKAMLDAKCTRSGKTVTGERCSWQDLVYINSTEEDYLNVR